MLALLAVLFVILHALALRLAPAHGPAVSYAFLIAAPAIAAGTAVYRRVRGRWSEPGWSLMAAGLMLWTLGMLSSMSEDLMRANDNQAPGETTLLYVLFGVPLSYMVATVGVDSSRLQRGIDALLAMLLGYLYFALMFAWIDLHGAENPAAVSDVMGLFDLENAFLAATALLRFMAADSVEQRNLFGVFGLFIFSYGAIAAYYNHHITIDVAPNIGTVYDAIVDVPFLLFAVAALKGPSRISQHLNPPQALVRFVRTGSPLLLSLAVLITALPLLRVRFELGVSGIIAALLAYGLRSILSQLRQSDTQDALRNAGTVFAELALRDSLTGVANRRAFDEALEREWRLALRNQQPMSLLMVDVDFFKQYNDRYGHLAGDACLRQLAAGLHQGLQRPGDLLARYGGEEFVLILPNTPSNGALRVGRRLCTLIRELDVRHEDSPFEHITVSIGVACILPREGEAPADLIGNADRALYLAKQRGRDRAELSLDSRLSQPARSPE